MITFFLFGDFVIPFCFSVLSSNVELANAIQKGLGKEINIRRTDITY